MNNPREPSNDLPTGHTADLASCCDKSDHSCSSTFSRRELLQIGGASAAMAALTRSLPVMAGPFEDENEYLKVIQSDKKLDPAWIKSLFERGEKEVYRDTKALNHIGMPVGGFFAGTVYLSGDGRLWLWDIFNRDQEGIQPRNAAHFTGIGRAPNVRSGLNYLQPAKLHMPFKQGFALRIGDKVRSLDQDGFASITFDGRYPIGQVSYRDDRVPVTVSLSAFSPFIPLNVDDSSLPATVMQYTIKNDSDSPVTAELVGHLQNAVCLETREQVSGQLRNRVVREAGLAAVECLAEPARSPQEETRPDISLEKFEKATYEGWTVEGTAFGAGPILAKDIPSYQGNVGGQGNRLVNSHATAPGDDVAEKDGHVGRLLSKPFAIERRYIQMLVGGGSQAGKTCVNLRIGDKVVASVSGRNQNTMHRTAMDVRKYEGQQAQLEIVDQVKGPWGNIGVDNIVLTDQPLASGKLTEQRDFGTMALTLIGGTERDRATASRDEQNDSATAALGEELIGEVGRTVTLQPGESATVTFVISWHFPNFYSRGCGSQLVGHSYASRFESALEVARYTAANFERLAVETRKWVDTWYDSTLPYWLLDRTMANTSTLATTTCYRFKDGRFWAWEGIGCCAGTCTHVWHYAQAPGRLFPEIERIERERVNFGIGFHDDGGIGMRTSLTGSNHSADDGQCGRILGVLREHQMSADDAFLRRNWPKVKQAIEFMIRKDGNADGMIEGSQPNTLDAAWFGKISFLASLYLAMLRAGEAMAIEMGDTDFARQCKTIAQRGAESILATYNGEYFVQIEDPKYKDKIGVGPGCYIDQVFGQTWAHWLGLGPLFDREKQVSALRALWKYNFVPDVGPFREKFTRGRWYAAAGDAGLLMCTWPKGGQNQNFHKHWQTMYFNECMSGFEWQAAAHMIWEGIEHADLLQYGLAISRAIHDRYHAALRNPYNEIECSDHYSRAMASYGVFQAVTGLEYHGPKGHIGFAPRLTPENFRAAFTAAEGWGTFSQQRTGKQQINAVAIKWGALKLRTLTLALPETTDDNAVEASVHLGGKMVDMKTVVDGHRLKLVFTDAVHLRVGQELEVRVML